MLAILLNMHLLFQLVPADNSNILSKQFFIIQNVLSFYTFGDFETDVSWMCQIPLDNSRVPVGFKYANLAELSSFPEISHTPERHVKTASSLQQTEVIFKSFQQIEKHMSPLDLFISTKCASPNKHWTQNAVGLCFRALKRKHLGYDHSWVDYVGNILHL